MAICRSYLPWEFAMAICRENLPWLIAVRIYCGYLPWDFCIYKQILFGICKQILFIWREANLFRCEQIFFICEMFFVNGAPFRYCRGSYGPPVFGKFGIFKVLIYLDIGQHTWKSFVTASKHNFGIMSRTYNSGCFTILPRGWYKRTRVKSTSNEI